MDGFPGTPKKLLLRSTNWIGDAVMTTPAIRSIRAHFPDTEITLLAHPWVTDVFSASPRVDRILVYEKHGRHKGIRGLYRLGAELRRERFDTAILLQNAFEAALLARLAGIPCRGGYNTDGRGLLLSHPVRRSPTHDQRHQVHYYQEMLQGLGVRTGSDALELFLPETLHEQARRQLEHHSGTTKRSGPVIGLNPGAAYGPAKRWPAEQFAAVARRMISEHNACVVLFGTGADRDTARRIIDSAGEGGRSILDLSGRTTLLEAMAHIGCCDCFITNDSGLMHVAAALQRPVVAIFGSTNPVTTGPHSPNAAVVREPLSCSPCLEPVCPEKHFNCMRRITADRVYAEADRLLQGGP